MMNLLLQLMIYFILSQFGQSVGPNDSGPNKDNQQFCKLELPIPEPIFDEVLHQTLAEYLSNPVNMEKITQIIKGNANSSTSFFPVLEAPSPLFPGVAPNLVQGCLKEYLRKPENAVMISAAIKSYYNYKNNYKNIIPIAMRTFLERKRAQNESLNQPIQNAGNSAQILHHHQQQLAPPFGAVVTENFQNFVQNYWSQSENLENFLKAVENEKSKAPNIVVPSMSAELGHHGGTEHKHLAVRKPPTANKPKISKNKIILQNMVRNLKKMNQPQNTTQGKTDAAEAEKMALAKPDLKLFGFDHKLVLPQRGFEIRENAAAAQLPRGAQMPNDDDPKGKKPRVIHIVDESSDEDW